MHKLVSFCLFMAAPLLITFFGGIASFFPNAVAHELKIGNFSALEITLSDSGCQVLAEKNFSPCQKIGEGNKIFGAYVMSRMGVETFLKIPYSDSEGAKKSFHFRNVYLPSKEILGLKLDERKRFFHKAAVEKYFQNRNAVDGS